MSLVAVGKVISGSECLQGTDTAIEEDGEGEGRRDEGERREKRGESIREREWRGEDGREREGDERKG